MNRTIAQAQRREIKKEIRQLQRDDRAYVLERAREFRAVEKARAKIRRRLAVLHGRLA